MKKEKRLTILIGLIMFVTGIAAVVLGIFLIKDKIEKDRTFISTTGIVVSYDAEGGYDDDLYDNYFYKNVEYAPIVEYVVDGEVYHTVHNVYSSTPEYFIGQKVSLKYNPNDPEDVIFKYNNAYWIILLFGVVFTGCGITATFSGIFKKNKTKIYT